MNLVNEYLSLNNIFKRFRFALFNQELLPLLKEENLNTIMLERINYSSEFRILLKDNNSYIAVAIAIQNKKFPKRVKLIEINIDELIYLFNESIISIIKLDIMVVFN